MTSSEQDAPGSRETEPGVPSGTQVILGEQAYNTLMQASSGESTGLLLGVSATAEQEGAVNAAVKLSLAPDRTGFLLTQHAIERMSALTVAGQPAQIIGWFYANPDLDASTPQISLSGIQALLPPEANLFALVNPADNTGAFYLWDSASYHPTSVKPASGSQAIWAGEPAGAALALGDLLYHEAPAEASAPIQAEQPTAPIPIGALTMPTRTDETVPLPAFLRRKYNLEVLRLKSSWPEWAHAGASAGGAMSALRHNTAVLFSGQANRRIAVIALGALLSVIIGSTLVYAGLHASGSSTQNDGIATPTSTLTIPVVVVEPTASATQPEVVVATDTPPATPTLMIVADTATPTTEPTSTIEPTSTVADTETPTPVPTAVPTRVPTRRPVPPTNTSIPEPPPTEVTEQPTDTPEPIVIPTDTVEEPTSTPIEPTATTEPSPSPNPTETPFYTPEPTHRPTPMPGLFTPTPELPTLEPPTPEPTAVIPDATQVAPELPTPTTAP